MFSVEFGLRASRLSCVVERRRTTSSCLGHFSDARKFLNKGSPVDVFVCLDELRRASKVTEQWPDVVGHFGDDLSAFPDLPHDLRGFVKSVRQDCLPEPKFKQRRGPV